MDIPVVQDVASAFTPDNMADTLSSIEEFCTESELDVFGKELETELTADGQGPVSSATELQRQLDQVLKQRTLLQERRSRGLHRGAATFQEFATCLAEVLDNYGPVADLLQDSGVPYAKLGFQVIAHLLAPARVKSSIDSALFLQLQQIRDTFPRMQILRNAYRNRPELRNPFMQMHVGIVKWCTEAGEYFSSGWTRFKSIFTGTGDTFGKLMKILLQIGDWTTALLHENVAGLTRQAAQIRRDTEASKRDLHEVNIKLHEQNSNLRLANEQLDETQLEVEQARQELHSLRTQIDGLREEQRRTTAVLTELHREETDHFQQEDEERYSTLQDSVCGSDHLPMDADGWSHLSAEISKGLEYRLHQRSGYFGSRSWSAEELVLRKDFQRWHSRSNSKILLLGTSESPSETGYSWISTAPLAFVQDVQSQGEVPETRTVLYTCHPDPWADFLPDFIDIIANIVVQVFRGNKALLRRRELRDCNPTTLQKWRKDWKRGEADHLVDYVGKVLVSASQQIPLLILVDRLDTCQNFNRECEDILDVLGRLVQGCTNTKILVTSLVQDEDSTRVCEGFLKRDIVEGDVKLRSRDRM